ncbi:hypothetical protein HXX76_015155 [Chlamydomonas incerta]|uniref:Uncharacterized protein n=1 Tax=Chlamydomonas incerta TaxID=51695 RepID=A0A835SAC6_CHLIN|nr:hypothetical protein HXX76_015155 [Chlamydomonas incerta]|eukprot:KAG2423638.1 hypothetical protein HXX76_015155 [Chlamydomonas incerta]
MGADVARNITVLSLEGALDLPTLTTVSLVLAGTLRHVHTLKLNTNPRGAGGFGNLYALHSALRGAFPALQELCLPGMACLRGLEAFAGSALHTLRHLDLAGAGWDAGWNDYDVDEQVWDDLDADEGADADDDEVFQAGADAELAAALGDATLLEMLRGREELVQETWALRRLLTSTPPALESLRLPWIFREINFMGGRIARVVMSEDVCQIACLCRAAAALVPRLEATGQRLPLLEVESLMEDPAGVTSLLQPHTAFARLLAKCDRVELGRLELELDVGSRHPGPEAAAAAAAAAALQAVARAMGGRLPGYLHVRGSIRDYWYCRLQMQPRCCRAGGDIVAAANGRSGGRGHGTGGVTMAAPAAVPELTAEQVLERAADKMWAAASVQGAASMAEAAMDAYLAAGAAAPRERGSLYNKLVRMNVLLRGPLVWQLTFGPGSGGGAPLLTDWLGSLVAAGLPPPGMRVGAAAGAAGLKLRGCSYAPCGPGSAMAVVTCDCPFAALQLHRAAAAAARETPSCLQVSAAGPYHQDCWRHAVSEVIEKLWDDHLSSAPRPAAAAARAAAAAGTAARADGPSGGGGGGGGGGGNGGPAKTTAAGAGGEPGRAPGGQPARDAAAGGGGGADYDLQVLMRLLQLLEQAQAAVVRVELRKA